MTDGQGWLFEDCHGTISAGDMCGRCQHCERELAQSYEGNGSDWLHVATSGDVQVIQFTQAQQEYIQENGFLPQTPSAVAHLVNQLQHRGN